MVQKTNATMLAIANVASARSSAATSGENQSNTMTPSRSPACTQIHPHPYDCVAVESPRAAKRAKYIWVIVQNANRAASEMPLAI